MSEQVATMKTDLGYLLDAVAVGQVTVDELRARLELVYARLAALLKVDKQATDSTGP